MVKVQEGEVDGRLRLGFWAFGMRGWRGRESRRMEIGLDGEDAQDDMIFGQIE